MVPISQAEPPTEDRDEGLLEEAWGSDQVPGGSELQEKPGWGPQGSNREEGSLAHTSQRRLPLSLPVLLLTVLCLGS